jgi:basic membrane protein A
MTVGAIGVANENGVAWFGTQSNQTSVAPDIVVANQVYKWDVVLQDLIDAVAAGDLTSEVYEINFENGGLVIEYNDGYDLADDLVDAANAAIDGLKDGSITTGA